MSLCKKIHESDVKLKILFLFSLYYCLLLQVIILCQLFIKQKLNEYLEVLLNKNASNVFSLKIKSTN